ncbi:MAG: hypothetical protein APF76_11615 [Desulfitibacter sp. BRH_c19]|nr:MAG: hypothetical protein APF76_11615 [Desulfitibacter sp. BRH_c19]
MSNIIEGLSQNVMVDKEKCIYCGTCAEVCIMDNIRLKLAPCSKACPLGLNCQGYAQLIVRGEEKKALEVIYEKLPFPGILGRVCHHPCESECTRNDIDNHGLALRGLKRYLADTKQDEVSINCKLNEEKTEKVAIIGGGPAGMMAAYELRKKGYQTHIYEAGKRLGGMMTSCIPEFKLPGNVVQWEAKILDEIGVKVFYNTTVGQDVTFEGIMEDYDAVIIAVGMQLDKKLGMDGEQAENVYNALDFLSQAKASQKDLTVGKRTLIIGGGNTAINAAQTAYRLGAEEIRIVSLEDRKSMPAYKWEISDVMEDGIIIENGWGPSKFYIEDNKVTGIEFKRCLEVLDKEGRFDPQFCEGETTMFSADTVIIAIGNESDLQLVSDSIVEVNGTCISIDPITKQTNLEKVFAAGDVTPGLKTIVDAMAQGREAAESVYRYFEEIPLDYARDRLSGCEVDFKVDTSEAKAIPPVRIGKLEGDERRSFKETELCMSKEQADLEAKRCISCGEAHGKFRTCWSCLPCEVECPQEAIHVKIPYLMR